MVTNEIGELVGEIEKKVRQMIAERNSVLMSNSLLEERNKELLEKIEEKELIIKKLKEDNNYIKISQSVKQSEGNTDVKNKIDELVREIDKCIGLLNK